MHHKDIAMELKKKRGYHRHHVVPKHADGDDSIENLVYLTQEEHALAHLELYEKYGRYEDAMAFNTLSSQWLDGRSISGYKQSQQHIEKRTSTTDYHAISSKLKGRDSPTKGMKLGPPSDETRRKISEALKGRPVPDEKRNKISQTLMGRESLQKIQCFCIFCRKRIPPSRFDRHGLDKSACISKEDYDKRYMG
jgi:hypothetical protein